MKYLKLRIAWSVAWGVVAVLLCVLWVRSIYIVDQIFRIDGTQLYASIIISGQGGLFFERTFDPSGNMQRQPPQLSPYWVYQRDESQGYTVFSFSWIRRKNFWLLQIPYWFLVGAFAALGAAPWLPRRFSLRTLLIATTLVAVVLGIIVWMSRAG